MVSLYIKARSLCYFLFLTLLIVVSCTKEKEETIDGIETENVVESEKIPDEILSFLENKGDTSLESKSGNVGRVPYLGGLPWRAQEWGSSRTLYTKGEGYVLGKPREEACLWLGQGEESTTVSIDVVEEDDGTGPSDARFLRATSIPKYTNIWNGLYKLPVSPTTNQFSVYAIQLGTDAYAALFYVKVNGKNYYISKGRRGVLKLKPYNTSSYPVIFRLSHCEWAGI